MAEQFTGNPSPESHTEIVQAFERLKEKIKRETKGSAHDLLFLDADGKTVFVCSEEDDGDFVIEEGDRAFYLSKKGYLPSTLPNFDAQSITDKELKNFDAEWGISSPKEVVEIVERMLKLKIAE